MRFTATIALVLGGGAGSDRAMIFECNGVRYETRDMTTYPTASQHTPFIYATPEYDCVFVATIDKWKGVTVHQADEVEIRQLIKRFGIEELKRALPKENAE